MAAYHVRSPDLERYWTALLTEVELSSHRKVARDVGVSPTTLSSFLKGAAPQLLTVVKVRAWYYANAAITELADFEIAALMRRFVSTLPRQHEGVRILLGAIESAYIDQGETLPAWVGHVREHLDHRAKQRGSSP